MSLGLVDMMLYNADIKIAGNVITLKTYEKTQSYGYIVEKKDSYNKLLSEYELEKIKRENFIKSGRRAKTKIFDLVACNVGKHKDYKGKIEQVKFLTLTFKDEYKDLEKANLEITKFMKRLSYQAYGTNKNVIKYISVPELQKRGVWHYHIILFNCKYMNYRDYKDRWGNDKQGLLTIWGLGGVYINALKKRLDGTTIAKYVTKYISKGITIVEGKVQTEIKEEGREGEEKYLDYENYKAHNLTNKKRYQCSKGLIKPYNAKLKLNGYEWKEFTRYIVEYAQCDKDGNKEVYFNSIENEHRGQINILVATVTQKQVQALKHQISLIYTENRIKNTIQYKPKWGVIKNALWDRNWNKYKYGYGNSITKYDKQNAR